MIPSGLKRLFRIDRGVAGVHSAVDDELQFHFDMAVRDLMTRGMTPDDARREAIRRFGDVDRTRELLASIDRQRLDREQRAEWWSGLAQDLRYTLRGLRLKPGFTASVVLTLGLGIGANATMFGIVDRLLFRPPNGLVAPDRVHRVYLGRTIDGKESITGNHAYPRYVDFATTTTSFDVVATFNVSQMAVGLGDDARERNVATMSANAWDLFEARPVVGRFFTAEEDRPPQGARVAVLSYAYWRAQYAGRPGVIGEKIAIGPNPYTIIGVAPSGFAGMSLETPIAFVPITASASDEFAGMLRSGRAYNTSYGLNWLEMYFRRKPGVAVETATADLTHAYERSYTKEMLGRANAPPLAARKPRAIIGPVQTARGPGDRPESKVALWLVGVAAAVLLIACANVANLLLARALRRRREIAVRIALGVSRGRLLTQLLTESLVLAAFGGAAGVLIAQWGGTVVRAALIPQVEWTTTIADRRVLLFAGVAALVAGILAGLAPALQAGGSDIAVALKAGVREGTTHRSRLRTSLFVVQAALSVVLLVGAGLFVRSLHNVRTLRLGFDPDKLMWASLQMRGVQLDTTARAALRNALADRAATIPGVTHAARAVTVPFWIEMNEDIYVPGIDSASRLGEFLIQSVTPGYFETTGTRILRGRGINPDDRVGSERVMVVSQSMARTLWKDQEPIGKCIKVGADTNPCRTVVGVAEDVRAGSLTEEPSMHYYMPIDQFSGQGGGLFIRTRDDAASHVTVVRRELQKLMPGASYITVTPMTRVLEPVTRSWKLGATMFTVFGAVALVLAAIGLYSVIAYNVTQRTHEMGVRVALGAQARDVVGLIVRDGLRVAAVGVVLGSVIALLGGRWLAPLLFRVSPKDPQVFVGVVAILVVVAVVASWLPALRASQVDPNVALRSD